MKNMPKWLAVCAAMLLVLGACSERTAEDTQTSASSAPITYNWPDPADVLDPPSSAAAERIVFTATTVPGDETPEAPEAPVRIATSGAGSGEDDGEDGADEILTSLEFDAPEGFFKAGDGSGMIYAPSTATKRDGSYINFEVLEAWPELTDGTVKHTQDTFRKSIEDMYRIFYNDRSSSAEITEYTVYYHQDRYNSLRCSYVAHAGGKTIVGTQIYIDASPLYCITLVDLSNDSRWAQAYEEVINSIEIKVLNEEIEASYRPAA